MLLETKVVVVTGSTKGIGKGIALKVAEEGGIPVISGFEAELLNDVLPGEFSKLGYQDLLYVKCDVTKADEVENLMKQAYDKYGRIDALAANAGMTDMCHFEEMTPERWDRMIGINLRGDVYKRQGEITAEFTGDEITEENLIKAITITGTKAV